MAKRKRKSKSKPKRNLPMATRKRKRRSSRRRSSSSKMRRSLSAPYKSTRKRKRRTGLSAGKMFSVNNFMNAGIKNLGGSAGGAIVLLSRLIKMKPWIRISGGYVASVGATAFGYPSIGNGIAGATTYILGEKLFTKMNVALNDAMEDTDYVDPDTLQDSGMCDDDGNPIVVGEDGIAYALQDDELVAIGEASDLQSVSMVPLQDANPYDLAASPYALASGY